MSLSSKVKYIHNRYKEKVKNMKKKLSLIEYKNEIHNICLIGGPV